MTKIISCVFCLLVLMPTQAVQAKSGARACKENPKIVASCFIAHGRMQWGNGTPGLRIWRIGTNRMLGVTGGMTRGRPDDAEDPIMPEKLKRNWDETIYADFEVCPFTKEKVGEMQMVCIESARNVVIRKND